MKRAQLIWIIAAAALGGSAISGYAADPATGDSTMTEKVKALPGKAKNAVKGKFSKADKDNDGTLDKTEAADIPDVASNFDAMDTDKDGTVSKDEMNAWEKFAKKDKDHDGTLDKKEARTWVTVMKNFDEIDGDKDGTVSLAEINTYEMAKKGDKK